MPVKDMTPDEVKRLAMEIQNAHLYHCVMLYETRQVSWMEAMQIAAVELAKTVEIQRNEMARMASLLPPPAMSLKRPG